MGGHDMTPNVIPENFSKVVMTVSSLFLGLVDSLPPSEQTFWFPNQDVEDPDTWTLPHLFQLKQEFKKLVDDFNSVVQETYTFQDP